MGESLVRSRDNAEHFKYERDTRLNNAEKFDHGGVDLLAHMSRWDDIPRRDVEPEAAVMRT